MPPNITSSPNSEIYKQEGRREGWSQGFSLCIRETCPLEALSRFPLKCYWSIRDTKGTLHVKMGTMKDRNNKDLKEAEDIKKRWQEYTEKLY